MSRSPPDIPSPCIGVCALDPGRGECLGCLRTAREIQEWPRADNARKYEMLQDLKVRRIAAGRVSDSDLRPRRRRAR